MSVRRTVSQFLSLLAALALLVGLAVTPDGSITSSIVMAAADPASTTAIQNVIQRSNQQQVQAIASREPSVMADTATDQHYAELSSINQDLLDNGVASIALTRIEWGPISVSGATATATTFETWTVIFADGTTHRSRDQNDYTLVLDNGAWKINADTHAGQGPSRLSTPPAPQPGANQTTVQNASNNWAGYAAGGGSFTSVSGTWTVPQFNPADASYGIDATWVGIGGVNTEDLIQAGTQQSVTGAGRSQYEAWIETLPQASRPISLRVRAGDSISVSIDEQAANTWQIHFANHSTGQTYDETVRYRSSHASAEWVEEAPSTGRGTLLPLSNFGQVDFSGGMAVRNGQTVSIAESGATPITMLHSNGQPLAVPSTLAPDGASFSVARTAVASTPPTSARWRAPQLLPVPPLPGLNGR